MDEDSKLDISLLALARVESLGEKEYEVFECVAWGASHKEIADHLKKPINTVDNQVKKVKEKLGIQKAAEISAYYFCTRFNISFNMSPMARKLSAGLCLILMCFSEAIYMTDQQQIARRPRRSRTEVRYTARAKTEKAASF